MDISLVMKIAAVGLTVAVLNTVLARSGREDYAMLVTLAGIVAVLMMLLPRLTELLKAAQGIMDF